MSKIPDGSQPYTCSHFSSILNASLAVLNFLALCSLKNKEAVNSLLLIVFCAISFSYFFLFSLVP